MDQLESRDDTALDDIDNAKGLAALPEVGANHGAAEDAVAKGDPSAGGHAPCADAATASPVESDFADATTDAPVESDFADATTDAPVESESSADAVPKVSRKVRRRRRRSRPRSRTIAMKRLTREELRIGRQMYPPVDVPRPATRSECSSDIRPCPWVACKYHLYLDVNPETGSIKINFPDLEPWELSETCALDVAERGGITLEEVGEIMNLTRERIRQVEVRGLVKLRESSPSPDELGTQPLD